MKKAPVRFEGGNVLYWLWMTRQEWQLAFALSGALEAERLIEGGQSLGAAMRAAVVYLSRKYDFFWTGLTVDQDGALWTRREEPVEVANELFVTALRRGVALSYDVHFPAAIEEIERREPGARLELDMLRQAWSTIRRVAAEQREKIRVMSPYERDRMQDMIRRAVQQALEEREDLGPMEQVN